MPDKINIILVDDSKVFLKGLESYIKKETKYEVIAKFNSGIELIESKELGDANLILLDIEMPEMNGIETAKRINYMYPELKMIAITMYQDKVYLLQLIEAGFKAFVNKTTVPEKLHDTMDLVLKGHLLFPEDINL